MPSPSHAAASAGKSGSSSEQQQPAIGNSRHGSTNGESNGPAPPSAAAVVAANSAANKFSIVNINSQFKGKSIEPQQRSLAARSSHSGMQTLGKAIASRRMPPPAHLPSLAKTIGALGFTPAQPSSTSPSRPASGNDSTANTAANAAANAYHTSDYYQQQQQHDPNYHHYHQAQVLYLTITN